MEFSESYTALTNGRRWRSIDAECLGQVHYVVRMARRATPARVHPTRTLARRRLAANRRLELRNLLLKLAHLVVVLVVARVAYVARG